MNKNQHFFFLSRWCDRIDIFKQAVEQLKGLVILMHQ